MITADKLSFSYDGINSANQYVYNFSIPLNSKVAVLGGNGSGKSTLFLLMAGLLKPSNGIITIGEKNITNLSPHKRDISVLFQNYNLFEHLSIERNLELVLSNDKNRVKDEIDYYLDQFGIYALRKKKPIDLSGGEKQRAGLIRCLISHKPILLLDEPLSAIDPAQRDKSMRFLIQETNKYSQTMFFIGHNPLEIAQYLNKVIFIYQNKVYYSGQMDSFLKSSDPIIKNYLQVKNTLNIERISKEYAI